MANSIRCGHSACSQHFIDTGSTECVACEVCEAPAIDGRLCEPCRGKRSFDTCPGCHGQYRLRPNSGCPVCPSTLDVDEPLPRLLDRVGVVLVEAKHRNPSLVLRLRAWQRDGIAVAQDPRS